ncbi:glycosyltransferase family 1 protein [Parafrigoribacterium mesophilum]|uniref:rhamnosyltransferase WsaF family glycosyltransferase n=1 Tax=Parafrigoribacterium mesophilum TaxID=433646 RepID=UPI0031FD1122
MTIMTDAGKLLRVLRAEGLPGVAERVTRRASAHWGGNIEPLYLRSEDIVDSATITSAPPATATPSGQPLSVGWVITAPGPASGGHTTIFRFVQALESAGHRCVLYVYDGQGGGAAQYEKIIRTWWPAIRAEVRAVRDGLSGMDAYVATAWVTAHVLAKHDTVPGKRFYLVQDFEPYFYPRGSAYELAEDTYRFGFPTITVGNMVAQELRDRFGTRCTVAPFGCDTQKYQVTNRAPRDGVVFYAKPGVSRRGYEMGVFALELFHRERPDIRIHTFGIEARKLPFPATVHAHLAPSALNSLYNECAAGLALSFTNISLIATELLAAGVVPVVNDYEGTRADLNNPNVAWSRATPHALADALSRAVDHQRAVGPDTLRGSVNGLSWAPAQASVLRAIQDECAR